VGSHAVPHQTFGGACANVGYPQRPPIAHGDQHAFRNTIDRSASNAEFASQSRLLRGPLAFSAATFALSIDGRAALIDALGPWAAEIAFKLSLDGPLQSIECLWADMPLRGPRG